MQTYEKTVRIIIFFSELSFFSARFIGATIVGGSMDVSSGFNRCVEPAREGS